MNVPYHRDAPVIDPEARQMRCQHRWIATAKNVVAAIKSKMQGRLFFFDGDSENGVFRRYVTIQYCTNPTCDRVFYAEELKQ